MLKSQFDMVNAGLDSMVEYLPEDGYGRSIDLGSNKTVGKRGRHSRISNKARTVDRVNRTRMMQGRAKMEKSPMTEESVFVGVDVAKKTLDVADSNSKNTRQFENNPDGITSTIRFIAELNPSKIIIEAISYYDMPLTAALQVSHLPIVVVNPRQVRDFARAPAFWPRPIELMPEYLLYSAC